MPAYTSSRARLSKNFYFEIPRSKRPSIRRYFTPRSLVAADSRCFSRYPRGGSRPRSEPAPFWRRAKDHPWHWSSSLIAEALYGRPDNETFSALAAALIAFLRHRRRFIAVFTPHPPFHTQRFNRTIVIPPNATDPSRSNATFRDVSQRCSTREFPIPNVSYARSSIGDLKFVRESESIVSRTNWYRLEKPPSSRASKQTAENLIPARIHIHGTVSPPIVSTVHQIFDLAWPRQRHALEP